MEISLTFFLIIYFVLATIFVVFAFFNVYHAIRFGYANWTNIITLVVFLGVTSVLLFLSFAFIIKTDWNRSVVIFKNFDFIFKYFQM